MSKKKTYGETIIDHQGKNLTLDDDIIEYRRQMEPSILKDIAETAAKAQQNDLYRNKDFYIVMLIKKERIGQVPRTYIFARRSCPSPIYKQSVWKYRRNSDQLEFLWSIPDSLLYHHIMENLTKYLADKECSDLAKFVLLMESGELLEWVKKENGEKRDAVIKIDKESPCLMA